MAQHSVSDPADVPTVQRNGRPATDAAGVAQLAGTSLRTWQRNRHAQFTAAVAPLPGSKQPLLYDLAQAVAFVRGQDIPALPEHCEEHPDDLLTDTEAGDIAGIKAPNVRSEAADGRMPSGVEQLGRRWWTRAQAEERRGVVRYRGRIPGSVNRAPRERPADARAREVAADLAAAERGERPPVTTAEVAERFQLKTARTAERTIVRARELQHETPSP